MGNLKPAPAFLGGDTPDRLIRFMDSHDAQRLLNFGFNRSDIADIIKIADACGTSPVAFVISSTREIELRALEKRIADARRVLVRPRAAQALPERSAPDFWWKRD